MASPTTPQDLNTLFDIRRFDLDYDIETQAHLRFGRILTTVQGFMGVACNREINRALLLPDKNEKYLNVDKFISFVDKHKDLIEAFKNVVPEFRNHQEIEANGDEIVSYIQNHKLIKSLRESGQPQSQAKELTWPQEAHK